jgi:arsenate reductase-like glutaredoxin family protein
MGLIDTLTEYAKSKGVKLVARQIPREVMEAEAARKEQVSFYELASLDASFKEDKNLTNLMLKPFNTTGPVVFANGKILQGRKDDAVLFFDQKANQMASVKKPIVNLNLTGTIDMTQHDLDDDGIKDATNIVSKQIINQMAYNA